ncbi:MAG: homogentisate 1,2-dioxygenase [Bacillaceae bacterium]
MFYQKRGNIPNKRHTQFYQQDGTLYREQVMGTKGFSGIQSILYHHHMPTEVLHSELIRKVDINYEEDGPLNHRHLRTDEYKDQNNFIFERNYVLGNDDILISIVNGNEISGYYRNGDGDELIFVHYGSGKLETMFGTIQYKEGDYLIIPIGTIYRLVPDEIEHKLLVVESNSWIVSPKRYRNEFGQLLEHSPFCERDIRIPNELLTINEKGEFPVFTKTRGNIYKHVFGHHPFDVIGWDGYLYPYAFNIGDFEPITGRIHQPPPIHQTFEGHNFVICSFVPRLYDYHPKSIPAPYYHSNVNSDEVLYYVKGNFMSRKGISEQSITLHPSGIPHGPHPGKIEASIGKKETIELAVMIDTFRPLKVVESIKQVEDLNYMFSWIE